jgi:hypothetical protein
VMCEEVHTVFRSDKKHCGIILPQGRDYMLKEQASPCSIETWGLLDDRCSLGNSRRRKSGGRYSIMQQWMRSAKLWRDYADKNIP